MPREAKQQAHVLACVWSQVRIARIFGALEHLCLLRNPVPSRGMQKGAERPPESWSEPEHTARTVPSTHSTNPNEKEAPPSLWPAIYEGRSVHSNGKGSSQWEPHCSHLAVKTFGAPPLDMSE